MNGYLKQSTAGQVRSIGSFVDDTDFKTLENALTIANTDILLKRNGGASAAKNSGGATADGSGGLYAVTWDATDTANVGELYFSVKVAGALVCFGTYTVLEEAIYDSLFGVSALGYQVPIWAAAGSTVNLSATTIATATNLTNLPTIPANWLTAAGTAADFTTEIQAGLATPTNITAGTITTVTNLTNLPAITANWLTAAGTAADFGTEVGTAVWANATRTLSSLAGLTVDTVTTLTNLPAITANWLTAAGTAADFGTEVGTAVWANGTRTLTSLSGLTVDTVTTVTNQLTAAAIATGLWQDATAGDFTVASSIGKALYTGNFVPGAAGGHFIAGTNAATTITTGLTTTFTGSLTGSVGSVTGSVGSVTGAVGSVTGAVGSVTGAVGSIATGGIVAASIATDAFTNAKFADNCFDSANFTSGSFDAVWAATVRTLSAGDNIVLAKGTGVTGFNDIAAADVWAVGTRTITGGTVGTITGLTIANVENATTRFLTTIVLDGAVYQFTANALELGPGGGSAPTVGQIADEVQTRTIARVTEVDHIGPAGIDGSSFDANAIGPGVLDTGAISNTNFAAGAITSTVLANDAITAAKVAADVSTEINTALSAAHGAGAWGAGAGSGAFPITVTVNDGAAALQNVTVGIYDGATLAASGTTAAGTGQVTFSLDAATYTVALVKGGYTFTTASRTVTGNQTGTLTTALSMTASAISAPSSPANCTVAGTIRDLQGNALPGAVLKVRLVPAIANRPITANGNVVALVSDDAVADVNGLVTLELVRTDEMDQDGCTYAFACTAAEMDERNVVLAQATLDLADLP